MTHRITRRTPFLLGILTLTLLLAAPTLASAKETKGKPKNILFILVDDLGKEWISCYGAEDIETPNIDKLAKEGMLFTAAYSMPQCTPSRTTFLTGKYPYKTGYVNHWDVPRWGVCYFDWGLPRNLTWARLLKKAGYATAAAGKWQINDFRVEPEAMKKHGFDTWAMWTGYETGVGASGKRYWDAYVNTPEGSKTYKGEFGPDVYANSLLKFLDDQKKNHPEQPFAIYFPMALTHGPLTTTTLEPKAKDKHKAMVRYTDHLVGKLTKKLDELGLRESTVIFFTTDNGTSGGTVGTLNGRKIKGAKGKISEAGSCEPFIVSCPGMIKEGTTTNALTDFTDMFPTFCELANVTIPADVQKELDGVSIVPVLTGKEKNTPRDYILAMGHGAAKLDADGVRGVQDFAERGIRDQRYKVWVDPSREITRLHDLTKDPDELENLVDSDVAEHKAAIEKFTAIVAKLPEKDARPAYRPRAANSWDKKAGSMKEKKRKGKKQK